MLTLIVAIKSETECEPELLLFAGMNEHLHAAGLLEEWGTLHQRKSGRRSRRSLQR